MSPCIGLLTGGGFLGGVVFLLGLVVGGVCWVGVGGFWGFGAFWWGLGFVWCRPGAEWAELLKGA